MCHLCKTKPIYEFTNKRKLCKKCFIKWFQKKVLYTIRKFNLINRVDVIGYENKGDFRGIVLEDVLKMFAEKAPVKIVKLHSPKARDIDMLTTGSAKLFTKKVINAKKFSSRIKLAVPLTMDIEAYKIINTLIKRDVKKLNEITLVNGKIIKPLYLFLDKEVLLYAKLKGFKFKKQKIKKNDVEKFIDKLEKKHPEVKRAVVNGVLGL